MSKLYVVNKDISICSKGFIPQPILVHSQLNAFAHNERIATELDRMEQNYGCSYLLGFHAIVGTIAGAIVGAAIGHALGAVVGLVAGTIKGAQAGAKKGAALGDKVKKATGSGFLGGIVGGIASVVGGTIGGVIGAVGGTLAGSLGGMFLGGNIGATIGRHAVCMPFAKLQTYLPCFCAMLTKPSLWSNVHEKVFAEAPRALMPDALLDCKLGGFVSIIKPDLQKALNYAKMCKYMYLDPDEDNDTNDARSYTDADGNEVGLESKADFDKYDPKNFGYKPVDPSFFDGVKLPKGVNYQKHREYNEKEGKWHEIDDQLYLIDENTGLKAGVYETPDGNYVIAYRGTHRGDQWTKDNLKQGVGKGGNDGQQYDQAGQISKSIGEKTASEGKTLDNTGHSLGGGLAALGAAVTPYGDSYVFNAADVHDNTFKHKGRNRRDAANVYFFSSSKDPLTFLNNHIAIMPSGSGKSIVLPTGFGDRNPAYSPGENLMHWAADGHDLPLLIEALEKLIAQNQPLFKAYADYDR